MYFHQRPVVEFPQPTRSPLYKQQNRTLATDATYRRRAVSVSLLWYTPPYSVMTPSAQSELGLHHSKDEYLPYVEKVLEWFRKNDEYDRKIGRSERK
ncbi:hypothetical protein V3C99_009993 [Haemonchus contortus]|uniref:Histone deacetylase Rpd3 n=1 Tax=Haemonchus contortus TaxID=6289 RepID=A0A7I5EF28_HAECO